MIEINALTAILPAGGTAEIEAPGGITLRGNVTIEGDATIGCYHFASEDDQTANLLASFYSTTVYVCKLSDQTVDQWVEDFQQLLDDHKKKIAWG